MKRIHLLSLFAAAAAAQLAVPAYMIQAREHTLAAGRAYRFPVAPVDPYDAFRGRYVAVNLQGLDLPAPAGVRLERGQRVYARIVEGQDGTARLADVSLRRPSAGDYLAVRVRYAGDRVQVRAPFDRFYLDEQLAPAAEQAYREHAAATVGDTFAVVKVRAGRGVLEDIVVGDLSLRRAAVAQRESAQP